MIKEIPERRGLKVILLTESDTGAQEPKGDKGDIGVRVWKGDKGDTSTQ